MLKIDAWPYEIYGTNSKGRVTIVTIVTIVTMGSNSSLLLILSLPLPKAKRPLGISNQVWIMDK